MKYNYKTIGLFLLIILLAAAALFYKTLRQDANVYETEMDDEVSKGEAEARIAEYDVAKLQGDAANKCSQAKLVATDFLNAQDDKKYAQWKKIADADCAPFDNAQQPDQDNTQQPVQDDSQQPAQGDKQ